MLPSIDTLLQRLFAGWLPKDWITLIFSAAAFGVSVLGYVSKTRDTRLSLRKQLTEVLEKITDLNLEADTFRSLKTKDGYPPNFLRLISDQRRFLVREAAYISREISDLVSPYEYSLIAMSFDAIDDVGRAEDFFLLAIKRAQDALDRGIIRRQYGRFLFSQHRIEEAREQMQEALSCFKGTSDRLCFYRADTLERWYLHESDFGDMDQAIKHLEGALSEFQRVQFPRRREEEVKRLRAKLEEVMKNRPPADENLKAGAAGTGRA